jgi:hypothetical protein
VPSSNHEIRAGGLSADAAQPGASGEEAQPPRANASLPRKVLVKATAGEPATVVVTVVQGMVRLSIRPPFVGEAIMTPVMVTEVMQVLAAAREEATSARVG